MKEKIDEFVAAFFPEMQRIQSLTESDTNKLKGVRELARLCTARRRVAIIRRSSLACCGHKRLDPRGDERQIASYRIPISLQQPAEKLSRRQRRIVIPSVKRRGDLPCARSNEALAGLSGRFEALYSHSASPRQSRGWHTRRAA
jgi:hypothetical protein